jgi:hypothetical protein
MKTRTGLVSNSSSTSFIVSAEEKKYSEREGLELVSVLEIKDCLKRFKDLDLDFICDSMCYCIGKINKLPDDSFISKPFDRDVAYEKGISLAEFATDL